MADGAETVKTTLTLSKSLHKQLHHFAIDAEKPFKDIVTDAFTEFLDNHQVKKK